MPELRRDPYDDASNQHHTVNQKGENEQKIDLVVDRVLLTKEQADWLYDAPAPLQE